MGTPYAHKGVTVGTGASGNVWVFRTERVGKGVVVGRRETRVIQSCKRIGDLNSVHLLR